MADPIFTLDNWLPMEPTPEDFISPPIIVWDYPTKEQREKQRKSDYDKEWRAKNKERTREYSRKHYRMNPKRALEAEKRYRERNIEKCKQRQREYYKKNIDRISTRNKNWRKNNPEKIKMQQARYRQTLKYKERTKKYREANRKILLEKAKNHRLNALQKDPIGYKRHRRFLRQKPKLIVIDHYSKGQNKCACCSENNILHLTIDHIYGDGNRHRMSIRKEIYNWLIKNNFPSGYQILCWPCNSSKSDGERCMIDHSKEKIRQDPSTTAIIPIEA